MGKKNETVKIEKSNTDKNCFYINEEKVVPSVEIEIFNAENVKVNGAYRELSKYGNKAKLTVVFGKEELKSEKRERFPNLEFRLLESAWNSENSLREAEKEAISNYIVGREKESNLPKAKKILGIKRDLVNEKSEIVWELQKETDGEISLIVKERNNDSRWLIIKNRNLEIKADFLLTERTTLMDLVSPRNKINKKSLNSLYLTSISVILLILLFSWKKIFDLIRNLRKDKEREEIDIF